MPYQTVDFSNVSKVTLVNHNDPDLIYWRNNMFFKKESGKTKRARTISQNKELFQKIRELYDSDRYERYVYERTAKQCKNCTHCSEDKYNIGEWVCWNNWLPGTRPLKTYTTLLCNDFSQKWVYDKNKYYEYLFFEDDHFKKQADAIGLCSGNIKYYLVELNIGDNTPPKSGWKEGKKRETEFLKRIKKDFDACFLPDVFKIQYTTGKTNFKFLDAFLDVCGEKCIIEYKSGQWDVEENQINDYIELFKLSDYYNQNNQSIFYFFLIAKEVSNQSDYFMYKGFDKTDYAFSYPHINKFSESLFFECLKYQKELEFFKKTNEPNLLKNSWGFDF